MSRICTIGLDLGTSSAKGVLLDEGNNILAEQSVKMNYRNDAGYIGFDAKAFADDVIALIASLGKACPADARVAGIAAVCASGNTLLCDADGEPLIDCVSWTNDEMNAEVAEILHPHLPPEQLTREVTRAISGWGFHGSFPLAHLCYLKVHYPAEFARAATVTMSGEYLLHRLCGKWGIDRSTATPFFLADQVKGVWHQPYLDALGITADMLPTIGQSGDLLGTLTPEAAAATGLDPSCEIHLGSFDHPGGARAGEINEEGDLLISCGTSWVCLFPVRDREMILRHAFLCDPYRAPEGCWAGIFSITRVGALLDEAVERYAGKDADRFDRFYAMAAEAPANTVAIDLDAPLPEADGNEAALARAVIEAIAYRLRDAMRKIEAEGITFRRAVIAGGPSRNPLCRQLLAETIGLTIEYRYGNSSGAVGAAMLARPHI